MHDMLVYGGTIVDGTGEPGRTANLAVTDGRISYIGTDRVEAKRSIDASGLIVAPGFIDAHTHYDAQITWDPWVRPHSQHGVTTSICGNCGFTLAPVTQESLEYLVPMLAKVEGIPHQSLVEGAKLEWNSTAEMLDYLDGKVGVNIGFMTGHSTLRAHVLGARATSDDVTQAEIDAMEVLLREALDQGSLGFSSSRAETHKDHEGEDVPSLHSSREELLQLMSVVKDYEGTFTGYVQTIRAVTEDDMRALAEVSLASNRVFSWPLLTPGMMSNEIMLNQMSATDFARSLGAELRVQAPSCPINNYTNFKSGLGYDQFPGIWNSIYRKDHAGRVAAFADQGMRATLEADAELIPDDRGTKFLAKWATFEIQSVKSEKNNVFVGRMVGDIAAEQGKTPMNALLDIAVEDDLETVYLQVDANRNERDLWALIVRNMRDDRTIWGGDDGGAHLDQLEAYSHGTHFIQKAVREYGLIPIEEAIHHFTEVQARFMGLKDRGVLAEGMNADIVIFDLDAVEPLPVELRADFPAGGERLYTGAKGFTHVIVNGTPIIKDNEYTWALPGTVLRARRDTYTVDITRGAAVTVAPELLAAE